MTFLSNLINMKTKRWDSRESYLFFLWPEPFSLLIIELNQNNQHVKPLYDYILERLSDNEILFRVGVNYLNGAEWSKSKNYVKKYKINQQNIRPGVLRFAKDIFVPIIPPRPRAHPPKTVESRLTDWGDRNAVTPPGLL